MELPQNIIPAMQGAQAAPVDPQAMPPADPQAVGDQQIPSPEEKAAMVAELEAKGADMKNAALNSEQRAANNQMDIDSMRQEILTGLFNTMKKFGVDPSDQQAVRAFLEKLSEEDPDMFDMFEMAFNELAGVSDQELEQQGQGVAPDGIPPVDPNAAADPSLAVAPPPNLMDKFKNLAPGMMQGGGSEGAAPAEPPSDFAPPPMSPV